MTVMVREHQGTLHEVMIVPGGFCWQQKTYPSLSTIAQAITGTSWNGPHFFSTRFAKVFPRKKSSYSWLGRSPVQAASAEARDSAASTRPSSTRHSSEGLWPRWRA